MQNHGLSHGELKRFKRYDKPKAKMRAALRFASKGTRRLSVTVTAEQEEAERQRSFLEQKMLQRIKERPVTVNLEARQALQSTLEGLVASSSSLSEDTDAFLKEYDNRLGMGAAAGGGGGGGGGGAGLGGFGELVEDDTSTGSEGWVEDEDPFGDAVVLVSQPELQKTINLSNRTPASQKRHHHHHGQASSGDETGFDTGSGIRRGAHIIINAEPNPTAGGASVSKVFCKTVDPGVGRREGECDVEDDVLSTLWGVMAERGAYIEAESRMRHQEYMFPHHKAVLPHSNNNDYLR